MGADRIIHAIPHLASTKSKQAQMIYIPVAPINALVSYYSLRKRDPQKALSQLQMVRTNICQDKLLVLDCGVYSIKSQYGLIAEKKYAGSDYLGIRDAVMERYDELVEYVERYAEFLDLAYDIYDYAFDFDADTMIGEIESDKLSDRIFEGLGDNKLDKIVRTYHIARFGVEEWWEDLCQDPRFKIVAIEGGSQHRGNPEFYRYLIDIAHQNGKKVHLLAITGAIYPRIVPADYMDASTHSMGGRKAKIDTPWGNFQLGRSEKRSQHIKHQPKELQQRVAEWVDSYGFTLKQMMEEPDGAYYRQQYNILYMNDHWDVPYEPPELSTGRLF